MEKPGQDSRWNTLRALRVLRRRGELSQREDDLRAALYVGAIGEPSGSSARPFVNGPASTGSNPSRSRSRMTWRDGEAVVACCADCDAVGCSLGAPVLFELVVAELVEALDDPRGREPLLHDSAGSVRCGRQLWVVAVYGLPVVHGVDEDLAGEQIAWELAEAVRGNSQNDDVCVAYDRVGRRCSSAGGEHVDGERDSVGRA